MLCLRIGGERDAVGRNENGRTGGEKTRAERRKPPVLTFFILHETLYSMKTINFVARKMKANADTHEATKRKAHELLDSYLEGNGHRHTPERDAILDAVYDFSGHFTLDELAVTLQSRNFPVSRATLYNTMRLFIKLRLVVRHRFIGRTSYEACYANGDHIHQVCTVCGGVREVVATDVAQAIGKLRLNRFRKEGFTLYIYGVCTRCQQRIARQTEKKKQERIR